MNKSIFKNSKVLVAGGTGMIGIQLVKLLIDLGARVRIASLDDKSRAHPKAEFIKTDLRIFENCEQVCEGMDYVFNLLCIKGSPAAMRTNPASFYVPIILLNTNLAEAAQLAKVKWYFYTSSVAVYSPAEIFHEEDVWKTFPSENDRFAGWAKRMGELQLEAYKVEYGKANASILRPPNVYGPHDNFNPKNAMVIPSLIKKAIDGENPLVVWGDGSAVRDFIHAKDVALATIFVVENKISEPLNIGSGSGISIKELVDIIINNLDKKPEIVWDTSKPTGDKIRILDSSKITNYGFKPKISFEQGIKEVMEWYKENKNNLDTSYNIFNKEK